MVERERVENINLCIEILSVYQNCVWIPVVDSRLQLVDEDVI